MHPAVDCRGTRCYGCILEMIATKTLLTAIKALIIHVIEDHEIRNVIALLDVFLDKFWKEGRRDVQSLHFYSIRYYLRCIETCPMKSRHFLILVAGDHSS